MGPALVKTTCATPHQPRRRVDAYVLIRDQGGRVLLIQPPYRDDLVLPGDGVHPGEQAAEAAARALADSIGLRRTLMGALAYDTVPANFNTGAAETLSVVLNGGVMTTVEADALSLPVRASDGIDALVWVHVDDLHQHVLPPTEHRIREANAAALLGIRLPPPYMGEFATNHATA
ncbi:NUDIX domain-containing protein [Kitasatospora sp. NPDC059408]|uniref:NUDIX domain-containing protein n=1 Tax=Kitasatospora sp. NPDC059408 TaxID=3346823 RepID=UPI00367BC9CD